LPNKDQDLAKRLDQPAVGQWARFPV